jgi:hypothetical protein
MGIRVLQFGVPLFGEPLANDEILPTMMLLTGIIDIIGTLLTISIPTHTLTFRSETKKYSINFLPVSVKGEKSVPQLFDLKLETTRRNKNIFQNLRLLGGIGFIIFSVVGLSAEYLWGTDLCMVGITYGIYLIFQTIQYNTDTFGYFTGFHNKNPERENKKLRKLSFIDVLAIGLLFYLSTLEFIWGWIYFVNPNALLIIEMILTTIIWIGMLFWIFVYLTVPLKELKTLKLQINSNEVIRNQIIFRIVGFLVCIALLFIKLI